MLRLRVKEVAKEKGFSQGKLARAADMATNTLRAIYRDPYREVATTTINKLARALDVPVTELIEDVSEDDAQKERETRETGSQNSKFSYICFSSLAISFFAIPLIPLNFYSNV